MKELDQEFKSWGREGLQAKSYINQEGDIVLKLFKNYEESLAQLDQWQVKLYREYTQEHHSHGLKSNILASKYLVAETGIIYYHDGSQDIGNIYIDGKYIATLGTHFVIQTRVKLVQECINEYLHSGEIENCKKVIDDVFNLIEALCNKGFMEDTLNYDHNYGYDSDGKMLIIDLGSFWQGDNHIQSIIKSKTMLSNETANYLKSKNEEIYNYHIGKCEELYARCDKLT